MLDDDLQLTGLLRAIHEICDRNNDVATPARAQIFDTVSADRQRSLLPNVLRELQVRSSI